MGRAIVIVAACAIGLLTIPDAAAQRRSGLVGALLGAGAALANSGSGASGTTTVVKEYGEKTLRPEQLKSCLLLGHAIDAAEPQMTERSKKIDAEAAEIKKAKAALDRDGKQSFTSQDEVDRFNKRVDAFNKRIGVQRNTAQAFNRDLEAEKVKLDRFNGDCAGHGYFKSDLAALTPDLPFDVSKY